MADADLSETFSLRWRGDRVDGVFIAADWQDRLKPVQLLTHAAAEFRKERGSAGPSWRSRVRLRGIPLDQMDEFVTAVRAARREAPVREPEERRTQHLSSRWRGGDLLSISADVEWMAGAPRQQIADELLELFDVPAQTDGPAVQWLMRMMGDNDDRRP